MAWTNVRLHWPLRPSALCLLALVVAGPLAGCRTPRSAAADHAAAGWITLFDSRSLEGWKASEHPGSFAVRDGMIVVHGERAHLFYVGAGPEPPVFTDFELTAEILTLPGANSGIFIHTAYQDSGWPAQGIEVQVNNSFPPDPKRTGSLYNLVNVERSPVSDGVWWEMQVTVQGKQVTVRVNGQVLVEYTEPADRKDEPRLGSGTFALQAHDPGSEVHFRNLRVRSLATAAPVPAQAVAASAAADPLQQLAAFDYAGSREALSAVEDRIARTDPRDFAALEAGLVAILSSPTATPAARHVACRLLLRVGSDACVPALAGLLADPELSHPARMVLERLGTPAARQALLAAVDGVGGALQIGVIHSLGAVHETAAVPRLFALADSQDAGIAAAALRALGEIGGPQVVGSLQERRRRTPAEQRAPVTQALLEALERCDQPADREACLAAYRALYAGSEPLLVRIAALEGLVRLDGEKAAPLILKALEEPAPELQGVAAQYVRTLPGAGLTAAFAARLPQADQAVQCALLAALAERGDRAAVPAVLAALTQPAKDVRSAAAAALEKLGGTSEIEPLAQAAAKARGQEREALCTVLSRLPGTGMSEALVKAAGHAEPGVRVAALRALALRREPQAGPVALAAGADPDAAVRREALAALPELVGVDALPRVLPLLVTAPTEEDRDAVRDALAALGSRATTPDKGTAVLSAALVTATAPAVRAALLRTLGRLGGPTALWAVEGALNDADPAVADAAVRALCDWPDQAALDRLMALAAAAPSETHRVLALRAAVRLLGLPGGLSRDETLARYRKALALGTRADERKAVLGGLAAVADPRAGEMILPELANEAVRTEAAMALLSVARRSLGIDLEQAAQFAGRAKDVPGDSVRREAEAVLALAGEMRPYLMSWQVAGPYTGTKREELFGRRFPPEEGSDKTADWKPMPVGTQPDKPWLLDLTRALGGDDRVAYLRTYVSAGQEVKARLDLGSDDSLKVWVNGRAVHSNPAWRGVKPGEDQVPITLLPGWNAIVLKVVQGGGDWGACARLLDRAGGTIPGLKAKAALTADESRQLVKAVPAELVLHWALDAADNGSTPDSAGAAGAGEVLGTPAIQPGVTGNCLVFDGVDDEVRLKAARGLPTGAGDAWSINAFVWLDQPLAELTMIGGFGDVVSAQPKGCQRYLVKMHEGIHFWGSSVDVNAGQPFDVGRWQMVTITYDGRELALYKNGQRVFAKTESLVEAAGVVALAPADHWQKGTRFAGKLDEFTLWRGALSQEQIDRLAAALPPKAP